MHFIYNTNRLYEKETPDVICHSIKFCTTDAGQPECHIFPKPKVSISHQVNLLNERWRLNQKKFRVNNDPKICNNPIFKKICDYIKK